jgi:hypothetical protein
MASMGVMIYTESEKLQKEVMIKLEGKFLPLYIHPSIPMQIFELEF